MNGTEYGWRSVLTATSIVGLVVGGALVAAHPLAEAVEDSCEAIDVGTGSVPSGDLQGVIDNANPGDTIQVRGVCVGNYRTSQSLSFLGQATPTSPTPTLNGNGVDSVLQITGGSTTEVRLTDLTVTNGSSTASATGQGGGIRVGSGSLILSGTSAVTASSAAGYGGGIYIGAGKVTLNGSSTVAGNTSGYGGGGIFSEGGSVTLNGTSSVSENVASQGGGIYLDGEDSIGTLNDSAQVTLNSTDAFGGSGIYTYGSLTLNDSSQVITNREGGIYNKGGTVTMFGSSSVASNAGIGIDQVGSGSVILNGLSSVRDNVGDVMLGGGIFNETKVGDVTLNGLSSVVGNSAVRGGGIASHKGGWVRLNGSSTVDGNYALRHGGGIFTGGRVTLNDSSSVRGNATAGGGGGIYLTHFWGKVILHGSSAVTRNTARIGGGIRMGKGTVIFGAGWTGTVCGNDPDDWPSCST